MGFSMANEVDDPSCRTFVAGEELRCVTRHRLSLVI
jgi:hypothetical protein